MRIEANLNYGKFNNRQKWLGQRDETKLHKQGEERTQGGLQHARQRVKCSKQSTKHKMSELEKKELVEIFRKGF